MKILQFAIFALSLPAASHATAAEDCETEERLCVTSQIFLIDGEDAVPYPNSTIAITDSGITNVTFSITQDFLDTNVDYIYPVFDSDGRDMFCAEENAMVDVAPGYTQTFTAECDKWGKASVELFVRDHLFSGVSSESNYRNCVNFWGASRVATYKLQLSCDSSPVCGPDYEAELIAEEEAAEEEDSGYKCKLPSNSNRYSVITRGDAEISASILFKAVAIGGTMSNPGGNKMVVGSESAKMSYMYRLIGKCLIDFKGYRKIGAYLRTVIDFEHFEYLARNAESRKINRNNIIVMTRGGTFDIRDFCTVCEGNGAETGNRLLIIFNTNEKVVLKGSADGLPFLASVIAPFSRVELDGSAGYMDGVVVADTFATVGDNASSLELRGNYMGGSLYCGPTEAPTWAPTSYAPETYENICLTGQILLTNDEDVKPLPDKVIAIEKAEESTVTFSITNQWKNRPSWIIPVFDMGGETMACADDNRMLTPDKGAISNFTAECTDGKAKVDVFIRDYSFRATTQENVYNCPSRWWGDAHFKGVYSFELSCTDAEICTDYTTEPVTEQEPEPPEPEPDTCKMPKFTNRYAIITKTYAEISMHEIQNGLAIGGLLTNPSNSTVVVGTKWKTQSYITRVVDECHIEFKGGRLIGKPLEEVLDFGFFENVARTAFNRTQSNKRKVIVMTHGGTFDTHDFLPGFKPQWTDGRKTVVVFNTTEKVILTSTAGGQPFLPSVIAPFSRVELHSDAGFMEGSIVAYSFATTGDNPSALSMRGLAYDGRFCDPPTTAPTPDPTAAPTTSEPTAAPTPVASGDPTAAPTTSEPTAAPTPVASGDPTATPTTSEPTAAPTPVASGDPTAAPTTSEPTAAPTPVASGDPTAAPITSQPTAAPTPVASGDPTTAPITSEPTAAPTSVASSDPTAAPITSEPTAAPTHDPEGTTPGTLGDPHFRTWTNEHFEYHGQCDLMLTTDPNFADGLGIDVQIRTKLVRFWSYIKTAAIRIGDDIFEFQGDAFPEESSGPKYWFNLELQGNLDTIGGFPISMIRNSVLKTMFEIDLDSMYPGQKIIIGAYKEFVRVDFRNASEESYGNVAGLLGNFKTGETLSRDGAKVIDNFTELGQEWQLRPTDNMLFHDISDPQFPKQCIEPEDPQGERRRLLEESSLSEEEAEAACATVKDPIDRKNCIYDILATQDLDMVGAY
eukprot:scaffold7212_cov165-Cylindrotheca_fusiformis.AAC.2